MCTLWYPWYLFYVLITLDQSANVPLALHPPFFVSFCSLVLIYVHVQLYTSYVSVKNVGVRQASNLNVYAHVTLLVRMWYRLPDTACALLGSIAKCAPDVD